MAKVQGNLIDVINYRNERVIFTHAKHQEKMMQHPELNNKIFLENLEETIKNPGEVWEDYDDKEHRRCYYRKYSKNSYVKAVIWCTGNPYRVVTAFEINWIKETKYPGLKQLK